MKDTDIDLGSELTRAGPHDAGLIGDITADAFRDDPVSLWLCRTETGVAALFHAQARHIYVPRGFSYRLGDQGACMWMLPGAAPRATDTLAIGWALLSRSGFGALSRGLATGAAMERHHPAMPHAYLFSIGLRPRDQGKGLGRKLIAPMLDACDRLGLPAYLENSKPRNTSFYMSCGFEPQAAFRPRPDAPELLAMLRPPRRA